MTQSLLLDARYSFAEPNLDEQPLFGGLERLSSGVRYHEPSFNTSPMRIQGRRCVRQFNN